MISEGKRGHAHFHRPPYQQEREVMTAEQSWKPESAEQ